MFKSLNDFDLKALKLQLLNIIGIREEDLSIENLNKLLEIIPMEYYKYLIRLLKIDKVLSKETVEIIYNKIQECIIERDEENKESNPQDTVGLIMALKSLVQFIGKEKELDSAISTYNNYIKENKDEERLTPLFNTVAGVLILCKSLLFDDK